MLRRSLSLAALALVTLSIAAAAPAPLGPPWISIEYPPSPYDQTTRDAFLLVHTFHHGTPITAPLVGKAEGIVSGKRRTVSLEFASTSRTGVLMIGLPVAMYSKPFVGLMNSVEAFIANGIMATSQRPI